MEGTVRLEDECCLASIIGPPLTRRGCPWVVSKSALDPYVGELVISGGRGRRQSKIKFMNRTYDFCSALFHRNILTWPERLRYKRNPHITMC